MHCTYKSFPHILKLWKAVLRVFPPFSPENALLFGMKWLFAAENAMLMDVTDADSSEKTTKYEKIRFICKYIVNEL